MQVNALSIGPDPLKIPGNISISANMTAGVDLVEPITVINTLFDIIESIIEFQSTKSIQKPFIIHSIYFHF